MGFAPILVDLNDLNSYKLIRRVLKSGNPKRLEPLRNGNPRNFNWRIGLNLHTAIGQRIVMKNQKLLASLLVLAFAFVFLGAPEIGLAQNWTQFRGSNSNGHAEASSLPHEFGEEKNLKWKTSISGRAWSSPVIDGDEVWLTTAIEVEATGEDKIRMMKKAKIGGMSAFSRVRLKAICVSRKTGKIIHEKQLFDVNEPPLINTLNSFASPTPAIDREHVYCNFGAFGTVCLKREDGSIVWKNQDYKIDHQTGPGSSPLLYQGKLYLNFDGIDKQFLVALNAKDGKEIWKQDRSGQLNPRPDFKKAFTTPVVVRIDEKEQLISPGADWVYGYAPDTGKELWKVKFGERFGFSNAPQPVVSDKRVFVCTGFMRSVLLAIDLKEGKPDGEGVAWKYRQQVPCMPTPIVVDKRIYFVSDRGIATCLDVTDKSVKWQKRLGGDYSASPIFADGKLFFSDRRGSVFVLKPGDEFELLSENKLDSRVMATPAAAGNSLFIRTEKSLYHFGK